MKKIIGALMLGIITSMIISGYNYGNINV